jgi:hypothetical protein
MRTDPYPEEVRDLVTQIFERLGANLFDLADINETVVIDGGRYAARSYRCSGLLAMWLPPVGIVQFYDADGNMLHTLNLLAEREPESVRLAA